MTSPAQYLSDQLADMRAERDALRRRLDKANAVCMAVDRYWMGKPMPYQVSAALTEWTTSEAAYFGGSGVSTDDDDGIVT